MSMLTPRGVGGYNRRHRHRVLRTALVVVVIVALFGGAGFAGWWYWLRPAHRPVATPTATCPPSPTPPPPAVAPAKLKVNVYNATARSGLAATTAKAIKARGFGIGKIANDPLKHVVNGVAEVRYGPAGIGAARTVAALVPDPVLVPDARTDASVDLVIGSAFKTLNTPAQYRAALTPTPTPRPSGC